MIERSRRAYADAVARVVAPLPSWAGLRGASSDARLVELIDQLDTALATPPAPAPAWLRLVPSGYHRVPGPIRFALMRLLVRAGVGTPAADGPAGVPAIDALIAELWRACDEPAPAPTWPGGARAAVCLTHDVDTHDGVTGAMRIAELEVEHGVRSAFYAPADVLARDESSFRALVEQGFEIGLHGLRHDFAEARLPTAALAQRYGETVRRFPALGLRGFRAPGLMTTAGQLAAVAVAFAYDSSSSPARCRTAWPYRAPNGPLTLPVTGTLDDTLFARGTPTDRIAGAILAEVDGVAARGGLAVLANHTEPHLSGGARGRYYREVVGRLAARGDLWLATPAEVARRCAATLDSRAGA